MLIRCFVSYSQIHKIAKATAKKQRRDQAIILYELSGIQEISRTNWALRLEPLGNRKFGFWYPPHFPYKGRVSHKERGGSRQTIDGWMDIRRQRAPVAAVAVAPYRCPPAAPPPPHAIIDSFQLKLICE